MNFDWTLAYGAAFFLQVVVPGPAALFVVATAMSQGQRAAINASFGIALGDVLLAGIALAGLSAVAAHYPQWWLALEVTGAAYLLLLGIRLWGGTPNSLAGESHSQSARQLASGGLLGLTNPRGIAAHTSLMPLALKGSTNVPLTGPTILAMVLTINLGVLTAYAIGSARAGKVAHGSGQERVLRTVASVTMIASAIVILIF